MEREFKFRIEITTDNIDGRFIVEKAAEKIACELDWGNNNESIIETTEWTSIGPHQPNPGFISLYHMEPEDNES